jgi:hypothetical protein
MDIPHWLIVLAIFAIIVATFARSTGEVRLKQRPGPIDAEDEGPYSSAMTEAQPHGALEETPRPRIHELKKARDDVQRQIEILAYPTAFRTQAMCNLIEELRGTLRELDECIAAEANPDQKPK